MRPLPLLKTTEVMAGKLKPTTAICFDRFNYGFCLRTYH